MEPITLKIEGKAIEVKPLVNNRAVKVTKVVARGRYVWALTESGEVMCADTASIRGRRKHRWDAIDERHLTNDDLFALGALGLISAKDAATIKENKEFYADYSRSKKWLEDDIKSIRDAGIKLQKGWQTQLERAALAHAKKKQAARRKQARENARLLKERNA